MNVFNLLRVSAAALLGLKSCLQEFKFIATAGTDLWVCFFWEQQLERKKTKTKFSLSTRISVTLH